MNCGQTLFVLLFSAVCERYLVNALLHVLIQEQQCYGNGEPSLYGEVRSRLDCIIQCQIEGQGTRVCYDPADKMCSCCADNNGNNAIIANPTPAPSVQCYESCPMNWSRQGGSCFYRHASSTSFSKCKEICSGYGGSVLMVENEDKSSVVQTFLDSNAGQSGFCWLAMISNSLDGDRPWYHVGTDETVTFFKWNNGEPNGNNDHPEYCAAVYFPFAPFWVDIACDASGDCVCQL